jgi:hypothetical protein
MKRARSQVLGIITVILGAFALGSPQIARATSTSMGTCEFCWNESTCAWGGGWTHCEINCPEFNGQVYCGVDQQECGDVGMVKLYCGSAT